MADDSTPPVRRGGRPPKGAATDPKAQKAQEQDRLAAEQQRKEDLRHLCADPAFLRFVVRLVDVSGYMERPRNYDPSMMLVRQGRSEVGHWALVELAQVHPDIVFRVQQLASLGATE